ncbi:class F sortase [Streptomyces roseoverticillatus]|nr:class F sortase [Streptomyces roseoverticillatus]
MRRNPCRRAPAGSPACPSSPSSVFPLSSLSSLSSGSRPAAPACFGGRGSGPGGGRGLGGGSGSGPGSGGAARPRRRPPSPQARDSRRKAVVAVLLAAALCAGSWLIRRGADIQDPPPQPSAAEAFPVTGPRTEPARGERAVPPLPVAVPTRVRIPAIDVDAPLEPLRLLADGSLSSPRDDESNVAGWYADGAAPGATGTAVVAGHVDTTTGPAVFYNLGALKKGYRVEVARADGRTALFAIDAIEVYSRTDFPSQKVYGPAKRAELRLITCGGGFSEESHAYLGNVVVYAHLSGVR